MSARQRERNVRIIEADSSESMAEEHVSASEALKLVTPFTGNKREVLRFKCEYRFRSNKSSP
jgi:hypothetical protein